MRRTISLVALFLPVVTALHAGEDGSISGVIKDSQGGVLPGVTVRVSGPQLPGGREAVTTHNGAYVFPRLIPGAYRVEATMAGLGKAAREVHVSVDVDAQVDLVLSPTVTEEVTVTTEAPAVDLKSTEVNFNFTSELMRNLPLPRSYTGLFELIPGVPEGDSASRAAGLGPAAGGSRQDNTYLMDGVNITNPGFGYLSTEINELDIAEFNVKRGAISAEFGRSAGFVVNAVSKSGTNAFSGAARMEYRPKGLSSKPQDSNCPTCAAAFGVQQSDYLNPALSLSGPIIKDKVFWYASGRYFKTTQGDRINQVGTPLPDLVTDGHELYGKITATPSPRHLLNVSFRDRPDHTNGDLSSTPAFYSPAVANTDDNGTRVATAAYTFFTTNRSNLELKYLYLKEKNESTPVTNLGYLPTWNPTNLAAMGQYTDPSQANLNVGAYQYANTQDYRRHEVRGTFSQFFDLGKTNHQLKVGAGFEFGEEELLRTSNGWGQLSKLTVSGTPLIRARYYFTQPAQFGQGRTWSIFAQDTVTATSRLTLNLGVLLNRDEYAQNLPGSGGCPTPINTVDGHPGGAAVFESSGDRCTFIRFGFGDEVQPRLGLNFNVREGKGDKLYAHFGRYYNMDQQSSGRSLAPRRIYQREARFNALTGALISDLPRASTTGKLIDKNMQPTYDDEWLGGYATPLGADWSLDLFYMHRNTKNFIEDLPTALPDSSPYAAANLPCTTFVACQTAQAQRKYQAFTVELKRRLANNWSTDLSYTYSKFEGNFDLDYSSGAVFNTSSFIQDGPGVFVQDPFRYGPLSQDRPHLFKLFLNYLPTSALNLGGYLRVQSGAPWNARAADWEGCGCNYLEPAGSHRNPTWANLDLLASYRIKVSGRANVLFEGRLFNVFNNQTVQTVNSTEFTDLNTIRPPAPLPVLSAPYFAPYKSPNPLFGTPTTYAVPRQFVLSAMLSF
jgi:hypothetical protein